MAEVPFDEFYRRELPAVAAVAAALTGRRDLGAEVAQEALLRTYRAWPMVSTLERPGAWTRRVAINLATDVHRRRRREDRAMERVGNLPGGTDDGAQIGGEVWAAVRRLPERQRAVVALHYVDDLSVDEIAEALEIRPGTVKSTLFSARRTLAAALGTQEVHDG